MPDAAISIRGLTKHYGGVVALAGVDLDVEAGGVFGFLGPNGAGKTTTLRVLLGLTSATSGTVSVLGGSSSDLDVRRRLGYLPDVPEFYPWMTGREFLHLSGRLFGLSGSPLDARIDALLELAGLGGVKQRVGGYSRGMRQRLGIAQALINGPELLMLDEPTSALDPIGRKDVLDMVAGLRGRATVFFSTHILEDVERVCDQAAILDRGRVLDHGPLDELKARHSAPRLTLDVEGDPALLIERLRTQAWASAVRQLTSSTVKVDLADADSARVLAPRLVADLGLALNRFEISDASLEDVFLSLVLPAVPASAPTAAA
ncbi:MAG TPA: ABC transporter ATP-binding protein [Propionibacteriaceae bacterium]|nr:ABC transporter ATP-binding protein [Propionibacteriaceae bacterium]